MNKDLPEENRFGSIPPPPPVKRLHPEKLARVLEANRKKLGDKNMGGMSPTLYGPAPTNVELFRNLGKWLTDNNIERGGVPTALIYGAHEIASNEPAFCQEVFDWVRENNLGTELDTEFNFRISLWNILSTAYKKKVDPQLLQDALSWLVKRSADREGGLPDASEAIPSVESLLDTYEAYKEAETRYVPGTLSEFLSKYLNIIQGFDPNFKPSDAVSAFEEVKLKERRTRDEILDIISKHIYKQHKK